MLLVNNHYMTLRVVRVLRVWLFSRFLLSAQSLSLLLHDSTQEFRSRPKVEDQSYRKIGRHQIVEKLRFMGRSQYANCLELD